LVFCVLVLSSFVAAEVTVLTPENFDSVIDGSKPAFVEFFAPWCGHCKKLAPEFEKVGEAFAHVSSKVVVASVDADAHKELGSRFDVHGFPTLKWFPKGSTTPEDYNGGRTAEDIISFISEKSGAKGKAKKVSSSVVVLTSENFDRVVLDTSKDVLVEFYAPWCGHCKHLAPDYDKVGSAFDNEPHVVIAKCDADAHKDLAQRFGVTGFPTLTWFPKDNKEGVKYEAGRDPDSFVKYINQQSGTHRTKTGGLTPEAGRVTSLDTISAKYVAGDRAELLKEAEGIVAGLTGAEESSGKYYLKAMKTIDENADFVTSEIARLDKMLSGSVAAKKSDEFTIRKNILTSFTSA